MGHLANHLIFLRGWTVWECLIRSQWRRWLSNAEKQRHWKPPCIHRLYLLRPLGRWLRAKCLFRHKDLIPATSVKEPSGEAEVDPRASWPASPATPASCKFNVCTCTHWRGKKIRRNRGCNQWLSEHLGHTGRFKVGSSCLHYPSLLYPPPMADLQNPWSCSRIWMDLKEQKNIYT